MKKIMIMGAAALALCTEVRAQSLDEGIKMVKYERYSTAKTILQPMAATNPTANYYLGLAELGSDNTDSARAIFSKYPEDAANMAGMARLAFSTGNATEGTRLVQAVTATAKKRDWQPYVYAGDAITYSEGNSVTPALIQEAIDFYKKALERNDNADIHIELGDAYQKLPGGGGEAGGNAMNNYEKATSMDPKNSLAYSRIGKLWYDARNYSLALTNFQLAKDADPANPLPYRDLANAYYQSRKYELAKQNIEQYLKLSDQTCDDKITYADILYFAKYYPEAIAKMKEVLSTCSQRPYMYRVLGYSDYETQQYEEGLQNMNTFFQKTDPKKIIASDYLYMGKLLLKMKRSQEAEENFAKAFTVDTSTESRVQNYRDIGEIYKDMNNDTGYAKAAEYYGKAVQNSKTDTLNTDWFWWGVMSMYAKKYDDAATIFEGLQKKYPTEPSYIYWRARVASAIDNEGKTGAAIPFYDQWLKIVGPNYERKPDLVTAYRYYAVYYYNTNDKAKLDEYIKKITDIAPDDQLAKQLIAIEKQQSEAAKAAPKGTKKK